MRSARATLKTERLLLRPFEPDDVDDALVYRDDVEFARFLPHIPQPFTRHDAETFVATNIAEPWDRSPVFGVVHEGTLIGTVNFEVEVAARSAMLGYAIGRSWWGRGLATEAARAAITWACSTFELERLWAATQVTNVRSRYVLEKLGMTIETICVGDHAEHGGKIVDRVVYSRFFSVRERPG